MCEYCQLCLRPRCSTCGFTKTSTFFQTALVKSIALHFVIGVYRGPAYTSYSGVVPESDFWHLNCCKDLLA